MTVAAGFLEQAIDDLGIDSCDLRPIDSSDHEQRHSSDELIVDEVGICRAAGGFGYLVDAHLRGGSQDHLRTATCILGSQTCEKRRLPAGTDDRNEFVRAQAQLFDQTLTQSERLLGVSTASRTPPPTARALSEIDRVAATSPRGSMSAIFRPLGDRSPHR